MAGRPRVFKVGRAFKGGRRGLTSGASTSTGSAASILISAAFKRGAAMVGRPAEMVEPMMVREMVEIAGAAAMVEIAGAAALVLTAGRTAGAAAMTGATA